MKIEDHPAFADKLPRICYVLGGEKSPIRIGEQFKFRKYEYKMGKDGIFYNSSIPLFPSMSELFDMINHNDEIIRRPQFSDDEKALFKAFHALGYDYWFRQSDGYLWASTGEPTLDNGNFSIPFESKSHHLGKEFLPHLACGQKVDAAAYLESEVTK